MPFCSISKKWNKNSDLYKSSYIRNLRYQHFKLLAIFLYCSLYSYCSSNFAKFFALFLFASYFVSVLKIDSWLLFWIASHKVIALPTIDTAIFFFYRKLYSNIISAYFWGTIDIIFHRLFKLIIPRQSPKIFVFCVKSSDSIFFLLLLGHSPIVS